MILIWILIGIAVYYFIKDNRNAERKKSGQKDAVEVLKLRYVNGEIDLETYKKTMEVIEE